MTPIILQVQGYKVSEKPGLMATDKEGRPLVGEFNDWDQVCLGEKGKPGRIPTAVVLAQDEAVQRILWSTGASWVGDVSEAKYLYMTALARHGRLRADFPDHFPEGWMSAQAYGLWLQRFSVFDEESRNTAESMERAARVIDEVFGTEACKFVIVTSDNHAPRALRDAIAVMRYGVILDAGGTVIRRVQKPKSKALLIEVVPAWTSYSDLDATSTLVFDRGKPAFID